MCMCFSINYDLSIEHVLTSMGVSDLSKTPGFEREYFYISCSIRIVNASFCTFNESKTRLMRSLLSNEWFQYIKCFNHNLFDSNYLTNQKVKKLWRPCCATTVTNYKQWFFVFFHTQIKVMFTVVKPKSDWATSLLIATLLLNPVHLKAHDWSLLKYISLVGPKSYIVLNNTTLRGWSCQMGQYCYLLHAMKMISFSIKGCFVLFVFC